MRDEDLAEDECERFVARIQHAMDAQTPELATTIEVEVAHAEARRHHPYVSEGHTRELAAPDERKRNGAYDRCAPVTTTLPAPKAAKRVAPHTVDRVRSFRFSYDVIKTGLKQDQNSYKK